MATVLAQSVAQAILDLQEDYELTIEHVGDGGAIVTVHSLDIGPRWAPAVIDVCFLLPFNYPFAAIYPYYTTDALARAGGGLWPGALQHVEWRGARVVQISLRANRWDPNVDTAHGAIGQVVRWLREIT